MAQDTKYLHVTPGEMASDGALAFVGKIYSGYGGITIKEVVGSTGLLGTLDLILMKYGTSGTVAGATIAHCSTGTATVWSADVPKALTITSTEAFVDESEHLFLKKLESEGSQDLSNDASVSIAYVDGIASDT